MIARAARVESRRSGRGQLVWRSWSTGRHVPKVLLVHGGSGSWLHWLPVIPQLAQSFDIVAVDLPGFGDSSEIAPATIEEIAEGLQDLCTIMKPDALVAFSFGAVVAAEVLSQGLPQPDLHVLAPGGMGPSEIPRNSLAQITHGLASEKIRKIDKRNLSVAMLGSNRCPSPLATRLYSCGRRQTRFDSRPASFSRRFEDLLPALPLKSALWSECDAFMARDLDRRMDLINQIHPKAKQHTVPRAGHWIQLEAPEIVSQWLTERIAVA